MIIFSGEPQVPGPLLRALASPPEVGQRRPRHGGDAEPQLQVRKYKIGLYTLHFYHSHVRCQFTRA